MFVQDMLCSFQSSFWDIVIFFFHLPRILTPNRSQNCLLQKELSHSILFPILIQSTSIDLSLPSSFFQRRQWHPTPVLLPGKSHGRRSLVGCSPWGRQELDTTERLHFHALEKEMATRSSVLAWRIPGTGDPGGLPSMGSHRVGHD